MTDSTNLEGLLCEAIQPFAKIGELLDDVPENTGIVLLRSNGEITVTLSAFYFHRATQALLGKEHKPSTGKYAETSHAD